ncbi:MAG: DUF1328 domain-containing protein [Proteobacteria bacterium]|nr:MAG: DUF1328 domain-containing protein [Pseudomonadota bacterium]
MVKTAIGFFVLGVIAILFGATGVAGISMEVGQAVLVIFLILSVVSFVAANSSGRGAHRSK